MVTDEWLPRVGKRMTVNRQVEILGVVKIKMLVAMTFTLVKSARQGWGWWYTLVTSALWEERLGYCGSRPDQTKPTLSQQARCGGAYL
jgi:hypothetical protein